MIEFEIETRGTLVDIDLVDALSTKKFARKIQREVMPKIERRADHLLSAIAPPRDDSRFVWSFNRAANARARRWWFWAIAQGIVQTAGGHYRRTNKIAESWEFFATTSPDGIEIIANNDAPGSEFLYGSQSRRQVPGHRSTGWLNLDETITLIGEGAEVDIFLAWDEFTRKQLGLVT